MKRSALVLGDPGPMRNELLMRGEIDVLWASSLDQAEAMLKHCTVDICISSPNTGEASELYEMAGDVPCLVLTPPATKAKSGPLPENVTTFAVNEIELFLAELESRLGLRFAKHPRVSARFPVSVLLEGKRRGFETINLSVSGVAIQGFPKTDPGTKTELIFELDGQSFRTMAQVVRCFHNRRESAAGLAFIDVPEGLRGAISRLVEAQKSENADLSLDALFGDLSLDLVDDSSTALSTRDVDSGPLPDDFVTDMEEIELPMVRDVLLGQRQEVPAWVAKLVSELSGVEVAAATGEKAPLWSHATLRMRAYLAWARSEYRPLPSVIVDEAYRLFSSLASEAEECPGGVVAQIGKIRAALLRDILWLKGRDRRRHGTLVEQLESADEEYSDAVALGVQLFQEFGREEALA